MRLSGGALTSAHETVCWLLARAESYQRDALLMSSAASAAAFQLVACELREAARLLTSVEASR